MVPRLCKDLLSAYERYGSDGFGVRVITVNEYCPVLMGTL